MTSSTGKEAIKINILHNTSSSKGNQTMKLGYLQNNVRNSFLQKLCRKWGRETSARPLFVFWKVLYEVKVNGQHLSSNIFSSPRLGHTKGSYKISDCLSRDMLNFNF